MAFTPTPLRANKSPREYDTKFDKFSTLCSRKILFALTANPNCSMLIKASSSPFRDSRSRAVRFFFRRIRLKGSPSGSSSSKANCSMLIKASSSPFRDLRSRAVRFFFRRIRLKGLPSGSSSFKANCSMSIKASSSPSRDSRFRAVRFFFGVSV